MSFVSWLSKISFFQTFSSFLFRFFHSITFLTLCIDLSRTIFDLLRATKTVNIVVYININYTFFNC